MIRKDLYLVVFSAVVITLIIVFSMVDAFGKHEYRIVTTDNITISVEGYCVERPGNSVKCGDMVYYGVKEFEEIK